MDVKFENTYEITPRTAREYYGYFFFRQPAKIAVSAVYLLFVCCGAYEIYRGSWVFGAFLILAPLLGAVLNAVKFFSAVKKNCEYLKTHKSVITITASDSYIQARNAKGETNRLDSGDIVSYAQTANLAFVGVGKLYMIVKKDSFSVGDPEGFKQFIKSKISENKKSRRKKR